MISPTRRHLLWGAAAVGSALAGCTGRTTSGARTGGGKARETSDEPSDNRITVDAGEYGGSTGGEQIRAAVDDLPAVGGTVYVPPDGPDADGRWTVSAPIDVPSDVRLIGASGETTLYLADGTSDDVIRTATDDRGPSTENVVVSGLVIEGNGDNNDGTSAEKLDGSVGIRLVDVEGGRVTDCTVRGFSGHGVEVKVSRGVLIEGCTATGNGDDGVSVSDILFESATTENVVVRDCTAERNADSGFEVDDGPSDVTVEGCRATNNKDGFVVHTHGSHWSPAPPRRVTFRGCEASDNDEQGFRCGDHDLGSPRRYRFEDVVATGNGDSAFALEPATPARSETDVGRVTVDGFRFEGTNPSVPVVSVEHPIGAERITVRNGTITGNGRSGVDATRTNHAHLRIENVRVDGSDIAGDGVRVETGDADVTDVTITGCEIHDAGGVGVLLWCGGGTLQGGDVADNECYNNGRDASRRAAMRAGISIGTDGHSAPSELTVRNNACYDDQETPTQLYGIWQDRGDSNSYSGNVFRGNETAGFGGAAGENI